MGHTSRAIMVVLALTHPARAQDPSEVSLLTARVVELEAAGAQAALIRVEVSSRSAHHAEPLEFLVRLGSEEHRIQRVPQPEAGRRGRSVPGRGRQSYWLMIGSAQRPRGLRGISVEVTRAGFHSGPAIATCPVTIGRIAHTDQTEGAMRFKASVLTTTNQLDRRVDVLILANVEKPEKARWLFPARIEPGADQELNIGSLQQGLDWNNRLPSTSGVKILRAEVVDWTAIHFDTNAPVIKDFATAWQAWHRWETPPVGVGGRYRLRQQSVADGRGVTSSIRNSGRFTIGPDGTAQIEVESVEGSSGRTPPRAVFEAAFRDLKRPSFDELAATGGVAPFDARRVHITQTGSWRDFGDVFEVDGGRITSSTRADSVDTYRWTNVLDTLGDGYVVSQRRGWQKALGEHITEQRSYVVLPGGVVFPTRFARLENYGTLFNEYEILFSELSTGVKVESDVPASGPAADALRNIWDSVYAYPENRVDVHARVEVEHRNTDGVWGGVRKVRGKMRLIGYRGFSLTGMGWLGCEFEADGDELSPIARATLQNAVADRLGIWNGRDFVGRAPFDQAFRGAKIRESSPGTFEVEGGAVARLVAVDGVPREVRFAGGRHLFFEWRKLGSRLVLARVRSGEEVLRASFGLVNDVVFPTEFRFERVFGKDWGPETVRFSEIKIVRGR